ncbi:aldehyde dehydrogenase family 3 member B1-like [Phyllobates terribilis]|uniref:aldehyde dehydrogenase family 3 member B1-like n=1 Tax=Phyllobates terribilis TaxID=111132 RepID=UPI003CCB1C6A
MDNASPSPSRWFKVLRRTVSGESSARKSSTSSLCEEILKKSQEAFSSGKTKPYSFRLEQLQAMVNMLERHESEFVGALEKDLRKPKFETILSEITTVKNEAIYAMNNLEQWMMPEPIQKSMTSLLDSCFVKKEPVGVVLIIGGWSSPVQLCLIPMVGAVAAGNSVVLKLSETCSHTAGLLQTLLPLHLDNNCYQLISGQHIELLEILEHKFDHVFYIGDSITGRQVMQAAAKHMTPVSLVLGGKNPCYVDKTCDLAVAARRIAWARFVNAGQNSLAPDYVLCALDVQDSLIHELEMCIHEFYGKNPQDSLYYGRMASLDQYRRVKNFLSCGQVVLGGQTDESERYIAPTVLSDVKESDPVMKQEILGPILPILTVDSLEQAIQFINQRDRPLAVYVYSNNPQVISEVLCKTCSGSFCANDSMVHSLYTRLPCGGVGNSGVGIYGGKFSFDTFSHSRACLLRSTAIECVTYLRYPPYAEKQLRLMQWATSLSRTSSWCRIL